MDFNLEALGWKSFEDLALAVARLQLKLIVRRFSEGPDQGRDGAGFLLADDGSRSRKALRSVAIQCKHTAHPTPLRLSHVNPELAKVEALVRDGLADTYILFTNRPVSAVIDKKVTAAIRSSGVSTALVFGRETLQLYLRENKQLRALVPRMYGLGDLSELMDERLYEVTRSILDQVEIDRFVATEPYRELLAALEQHRFALLLGEPASGKTTIMSAAALFAADAWGISPMWLNSIRDLRTHWNTNRSDQLILLDDAFGSTSFNSEAAEDWNRQIPLMKAAMAGGVRIVLTSRDYVFAGARRHLKRDELPASRLGEIVIQMESLVFSERCQIIYNHLRLGTQSAAFKRAVKPYLPHMALSPAFLPEMARRLADPLFTTNVNPEDPKTLFEFVSNPHQILLGVIQVLPAALQRTLIILLASGGRLPSPLPKRLNTSSLLRQLDISSVEVASALDQLDGGLVRFLHSRREWRFRHPSVVDGLSSWLLQQRDLLGIMIEFSPLRFVAFNITCGSGPRGAIPLPRQYWPLMAQRLTAPTAEPAVTLRFLKYRSSQEFIELVGRKPVIDLLNRRYPTLPLDEEPALGVALRLLERGVLTRSDCRQLFRRAFALGEQELDPYPLRQPKFEELLGPEAFSRLVQGYLARVSKELATVVGRRIALHDGLVSRLDEVAGIADVLRWLEEHCSLSDADLVEIEVQRGRMRAWATTGGREVILRTAHELLGYVLGFQVDIRTNDAVFRDVDD